METIYETILILPGTKTYDASFGSIQMLVTLQSFNCLARSLHPRTFLSGAVLAPLKSPDSGFPIFGRLGVLDARQPGILVGPIQLSIHTIPALLFMYGELGSLVRDLQV